MIKGHFESLKDTVARRSTPHEVSVSFYLGKESRQPVASTVRILDGSAGVFFAQDNLLVEMQSAWQAARAQLGITEDA